MAQPGDVVITTKEMYDEMRATHDAVQAMRGEIKGLRKDVTDGQVEQTEKNADFELRLRALEQWRWKAAGVTGVIGAAAGLVSGIVFGG